MPLNNTCYSHIQSGKHLYLWTTTLDQMSPADPSQTILSAILILKIQLWFLYVVTSKTTLLGERKNFMQLKYAKTLRKKFLP